MTEFPFEFLSTPLSDDAPCGRDLEYEDEFREMLEAGEDKPETEWGDKIFPARPPDWPTVQEKAQSLARRTRDLRVAVWLARSGARLSRLAAYVDALRLVQALLERHWPLVHPLLDASDGDDPTARLNALAPLGSASAGLADLRAALLGSQRGGLTVREVELAFRAAEPIGAEPVPTEDGVIAAILAENRAQPGLVETLEAAATAFDGVIAALALHVPITQMPELDLLKNTVGALGRAAAGVRDGAGALATSAPGAASGSAHQRDPGAGSLQTRADAMRMLDQVCVWLEKNDASNPAPLFIRRAQRLMQKNFIDIIRDLAPDTLDQIEKLAGIGPS